jgi:hypothetical protein
MTNQEKVLALEGLLNQQFLSDLERFDSIYETLEKMDVIDFAYYHLMTTAPIDCDMELRRLSNADYKLSCALITMIFREDHFSNGSFEARWHAGQVQTVLHKLIDLLQSDINKSVIRNDIFWA